MDCTLMVIYEPVRNFYRLIYFTKSPDPIYMKIFREILPIDHFRKNKDVNTNFKLSLKRSLLFLQVNIRTKVHPVSTQKC